MGKRICQFGIEHGRCRCMCPDKTIACDVPNEHQPEAELSEHERLTRALDAAQDEIERLISEKEALRERIQAVLTELDRADREYEKSRKACRGSVWSPQPVVFTPDIRALIGGGS